MKILNVRYRLQDKKEYISYTQTTEMFKLDNGKSFGVITDARENGITTKQLYLFDKMGNIIKAKTKNFMGSKLIKVLKANYK